VSTKVVSEVVFVPSIMIYNSPVAVVVPVQDSDAPPLVEDSCRVTNASE